MSGTNWKRQKRDPRTGKWVDTGLSFDTRRGNANQFHAPGTKKNISMARKQSREKAQKVPGKKLSTPAPPSPATPPTKNGLGVTNPQQVRPQLAKTKTVTNISPEDAMASPDYTVERKLDGMRALVHVLPEQDTTLIYSRTGQDLRPQFPELQNLHKQFEHPAILDGEILAESEPGQDNLELLQMRAGDKKARRKDEIPIKFQPFDVLAAILGESETKFDGADHTLRERKEVLRLLTSPTDLKMPEELHAGDKISPKWEGVVVKDLNSKYKAGKRTSEWVKHKAVQRATLLAYDTTPGEGSRAGSFGALKVKDAEGKHVGQIGSGFSDDQIKEIMDKFANGGAPFLVEVEYRFKSKTGLMVNTAYKGLRHDKKIADVF